MAEVFICRKGDLDARSMRDLRKAGVVVVESADPASCSFIRSSEVVSGSDMLFAALDALNVGANEPSFNSDRGGRQREALAKRLFAIVSDNRKSAAHP